MGSPPQHSLGERLTEALAAQRGDLFRAAFDESAGATATRLFDNLIQVGPVSVADDGSDVVIRWTLAGESLVHRFTVVSDPAGRVRALSPIGSAPLWWGSRITVVSDGPLTLLTASGAEPWLSAAAKALAESVLRRLGPLAHGWSGKAAILVPADEEGFAELTGLGSQVAADTMAATFAQSGGALAVAVNPRFAAADSGEVTTTLLHELVHLATDSPSRTAPAWVIEGMAEAVALRADPVGRRVRDRLVAVAAAKGLGDRLPSDRLFAGPASRQGYALASLAVDTLIDRIGWTSAMDELAARAGVGTARVSDAQLERWFRKRVVQLG